VVGWQARNRSAQTLRPGTDAIITPRYKLRTLLILLAVLPPLLWFGWTKYAAWRADQARQKAEAERRQAFDLYIGITR